MDFVYGELNEKVQLNTYRGLETDTAKVIVDNSNNTIKVIAHSDTTGVQELIDNALSNIDTYYKAPNGYILDDLTQRDGVVILTFRQLTNSELPNDISANKINGLSNVATSGNYNDLINTPNLNVYVEKEEGKELSSNDFTNELKNKLNGIAEGAQVNTVTGVKGNEESSYRTGNINITKENIGLGNVDNTSDLNKPISNDVQNALNNKADKTEVNEKADKSVVNLKANASDVYTKTETNTLLENKVDTSTLSSYRTSVDQDVIDNGLQNQITDIYDNQLPLKANSNSVYTKNETDTLLGNKANNNEVVKLTGEQTIDGYKTFTQPLHIGGSYTDPIILGSTNGDGYLDIQATNITGYDENGEEIGQFDFRDTNNIEYKTNKVTTLSSSSTDIQYPSAKATYTGLASKIGNNPGVSHANRILTIGGDGSAVGKGKARWSKIETGQGIDLDIVQDTSSIPSSYTFKLTDSIINELHGKADDSAVVHKTGDETISGVKTFNNSIYSNSGIVTNGFKLKTSPTSAYSFGEDESNNLLVEDDFEQFISFPNFDLHNGDQLAVVGNITTALSNYTTTSNQQLIDENLQSQIDAKANNNSVVHTSGNEEINGHKYFNDSVGSFNGFDVGAESEHTYYTDKEIILESYEKENTTLILPIKETTETLATTNDISTQLQSYTTTSDLNIALNDKVDKDGNKVLSSNDYTNDDKTIIDNINHVESYGDQDDSGVPTLDKVNSLIPTPYVETENPGGYLTIGDISTVATTGSYNDLENKPTLSTVATTGSYDDLTATPNLSIYAQSSELSTVAYTGSYDNLIDKPEFGEASLKNVDTTISDGTTISSTNLPTSEAVAKYVEQEINEISFGTEIEGYNKAPGLINSFQYRNSVTDEWKIVPLQIATPSNVFTGNGTTSNYLAKFGSDPYTLTNGPEIVSTTQNKYLRDDGTWQPIEIPEGTVPSGGTTGQILVKSSNTDYALSWSSNINNLVVGPVTATNGYIPLFDGTTGKRLKNSMYAPSSFASNSHTHGNIQNGGNLQPTDITIANGDKLVVTDISNNGNVARTSVSFDGSTTNQVLSKAGSWTKLGTQVTYSLSGTTLSITTI